MEEQNNMEQNVVYNTAQKSNTKKPIYKKWWFWLIIIIVAIAIIGGAIGGSSSDSDNIDDSSDNSTTQNTTNTPQQSVDTKVYIGESVKNKSNVYFTVKNVQNVDEINSYHKTDYNFVIITIEIYNAGSEPWSQNPLNCILKQGSAEYEYTSATYSLEHGMSSLSEINPGLRKTVQIAYETPTPTTANTYSIEISGYGLWLTDSVEIVLKDRS